MQEFLVAVSNFGFPIVVAGYLLFRFENKIEKLDRDVLAQNEIIKDQTRSIKTLIDLLKERKRL